jgi:kynurenine formamidase
VTAFDLSHPVADGMPVYPGDPAVTVRPHATHADDGYAVTAVSLGSHAGTHVDAPAHVDPEGDGLGAFDVSAFRFEARRVDLRHLGPRAAVPAEELPLDVGVGVDVDCLVLWTGWADHWGTDRYLDHPYLTPSAARRCAEGGIAVACDTVGPDPTPTDADAAEEPTGLPAHRALLGAGLPLVENLRNLGAPPDRFTLHAYPLALDADGAPARAVAEA